MTTPPQPKLKEKKGMESPYSKRTQFMQLHHLLPKIQVKRKLKDFFFLISNYFIGILHPIPLNLFDDSFTKLTQLSKKTSLATTLSQK
jgi:hypothetical protein